MAIVVGLKLYHPSWHMNNNIISMNNEICTKYILIEFELFRYRKFISCVPFHVTADVIFI